MLCTDSCTAHIMLYCSSGHTTPCSKRTAACKCCAAAGPVSAHAIITQLPAPHAVAHCPQHVPPQPAAGQLYCPPMLHCPSSASSYCCPAHSMLYAVAAANSRNRTPDAMLIVFSLTYLDASAPPSTAMPCTHARHHASTVECHASTVNQHASTIEGHASAVKCHASAH